MINNDTKQLNKQSRSINHKIIPPIPLEDLYKRKSTTITRFYKSNTNKIEQSTTSKSDQNNTICQPNSIQASQVNKVNKKIVSTSSTYSKIPSNKTTTSRHNNNCIFKRIPVSKDKKNPMEIDINSSTFFSNHTNAIYPKNIDPSNHTNIKLSFDSSIDHVPPTNNKNKILKYNQHQVSETKQSHLSNIKSKLIKPPTNIKSTYRKEKSSVHSLENNITKIRYQFPPVLTTNNMRDN